MNKTNKVIRAAWLGAALGGAGLLMAGCAADAVRDPAVARVRADLTELQADPTLSSLAPLAIHDAEAAVVQAEQTRDDPAAVNHLVYVADRRVQIARAQAQTAYAEDQRKMLSDQGGKIQLDARTQEADLAKRRNGMLQAQTDSLNRKSDSLQAETDAANRRNEALQAESNSANDRNDNLQAQLAALQAKKTDRGMVLTLGDVLFSSGRADLKPGGASTLDRLVTFLGQAPDRNVRIEGHTDNVGSQSMNQALSQRRADSVASYLTGHGIAASRVVAVGEGFSMPVADNSTNAGRQANRRVEVIIANPTEPTLGSSSSR